MPKKPKFLDDSRGSFSINDYCFIVLLLGAVWLFPHYSLGLLSSFLVVDERPERADAIVVLLGASKPDRVLKAFHLYQEGYAQRIVFAGGQSIEDDALRIPKGFRWRKQGAQYKTAFKSLGLPEQSVLTIDAPNAFDTAHELSAIAGYANARNWHDVILVSSASHTRRVNLIWNRVGQGIEAVTVAAPQHGFDVWWRHGAYRRAVGYEYGALAKESWSQLGYLSGRFRSWVNRFMLTPEAEAAS